MGLAWEHAVGPDPLSLPRVVDYSLAGPWTRIEPGATRNASFARSMAINIPLRRVIHTQKESDGVTLAIYSRLLRAHHAG